MPGTRANALKVYRAWQEGIRTAGVTNISRDTPWGSGRDVYRIGDVVYKTDRYGDNAREAKCFKHFAKESWSSPVSLFRICGMDILCMPYYPNEADDLEGSSEIEELEDKWMAWAHTQRYGWGAIADFHGGNIRTDYDGTLKVIDAAGTDWEDSF
jgi:hypothetical protein